ncbi:MMPL family transporter [Streptomyces sodiiphilus]|uniref:MMPL family transporter n=1 Tax=Streptomyces sodiiphilus TaxID=226217 RepID=A0ABN2PNF3_9ACTN
MGAVSVETEPGRRDTSRRPARATGWRRGAPWAVVGLWLVLLALAGPYAGLLSGATVNDTADHLPDSADSTRVLELRKDLPGGETTDVVLVYQRDGGLTEADREAARQHVAGITADWEPAGEVPSRGIPSADGGTEMYPLSLGGLTGEEDHDAVAAIRATVAEDLPDGLTVLVGGQGAIGVDMSEVFSDIDGFLMLATIAVVTLLLVLIYRSPTLWLLPLLCVGAAASVAMAVVYGLVQVTGLTVTTMSSSIMTILVFGAGTDYALLLVARYREELRVRELPHDAMLAALRGSGPAILASSGTVAAGLLCLLAADLNSISGFGLVAAVGVLCALVAMLTLMPALLVLLGRRVFWPLTPVPDAGQGPSRAGIFARMGSSVSRRPVTILVTGVLMLAAMSAGVLNLPGQLSDEDSFTTTPESVTAMQQLAEAYPEQSSRPIIVMAPAQDAVAAVERARATEGVAGAEAGRSSGGWTEVSVRATAAPGTDGERDTVDALRAAFGTQDAPSALVGGTAAEQLDMARAASADQKLVIPLVLGAVLLILIALLRSITGSVMLLTAVVASWAAALGLGGLLFEPVFGFRGIDPSLPLMTFVFGVALGVDYGIFLMHRMREEVMGGLETRPAALVALRSTGGVIASAGIVLAATFSVLMTMPLVFMFQIGFVVAVGVLLDTFLVRTYVVTSASWLLGRRVWWPGALYRRRSPAPDAR